MRDAVEALRRSRPGRLVVVMTAASEATCERLRAASHSLNAESRLEIVPGATHLFSEPGALERVATLAADWFTRYLPTRERSGSR